MVVESKGGTVRQRKAACAKTEVTQWEKTYLYKARGARRLGGGVRIMASTKSKATKKLVRIRFNSLSGHMGTNGIRIDRFPKHRTIGVAIAKIGAGRGGGAWGAAVLFTYFRREKKRRSD